MQSYWRASSATPAASVEPSGAVTIVVRKAELCRRALLSAALVAALLVPATDAPAHYWYPAACCNDQDCFKVHKIEHLDDGSMIMHAGHFVVVVPPGFQTRKSLDNDSHVCVYRNVLGKYLPRCVFMPGTV